MRNFGAMATRLLNSSGNNAGENLLAISMPKCGTHLLTRLVSGLTGCERSHVSLATTDVKEADRVLSQHHATATRQSKFLRGHQVYTHEIQQLLERRGFKILLILRDPRDTVVSHAHWVTTDKHGSDANRRYFASLPTIDERIMASICGRPEGWNEGTPVGDEAAMLKYHGVRETIQQRLHRFMPWAASNSVCTIHFEKLVGSQGGGCDAEQHKEIRRAAQFLGLDIATYDISVVADQLFDRSVKTFRKGSIGSWKHSFNSLHKLVFKTIAGRELIELGYEEGFDW